MKIFAKTLLLLGFVLALALPDPAAARAGGGRSSVGSRGARTYQAPPIARPIQRSATPRPAPQAEPSFAPTPQAPAASPLGFGARHPILTGIAGGFLGAGIANMLFGHGAYGMGASPLGSGIGGLLQIALLAGIAFLAFRWWQQRAGGGTSPFQNFGSRFGSPFNAGSEPVIPMPSVSETSLIITQQDNQAFQSLLSQIQLAWGATDMTRLRQYVTPEMFTYFSEELSANQSRGELNHVSNVSFLSSDLVESWAEASLDYATMHMKWSAVDYMSRLDRPPTDDQYVVSGDARNPVEMQEVWTFVRAHGGGQWLLSAIQQVA